MSDQTTAPDAANLDGAMEHAVQFDRPMPQGDRSRMPASFRPASWRGTLPADEATGRIGLSVDVESGETVRLGLDSASALDIVATLAEALSALQRRRSHSETSDGMPSLAGSMPPGGENV